MPSLNEEQAKLNGIKIVPRQHSTSARASERHTGRTGDDNEKTD
jgi:hypothetical protein